MKRKCALRSLMAALLMISMVGGFAAPAAADTTTTTGASVTVVDAGTLDVQWVTGEPQFLVDGEPPAVSAVQGASATATLELAVSDTRAAEGRTGYQIRLSASPFAIDGSDQSISATSLSIVDLSGTPEGIDAEASIGATLDGGTLLLSVPAGSTAVDTVLHITIAMHIPAGTYPGTFNGSLTVEVVPIT